MPIYPANPTYRGGFYNNIRTNGVDDRVYPAQDMREPYRGIFTNGVKPNDDGTLGTDLQVLADTGMNIKVSVGRGMFGGAFFINTAIYTITLDTAGSSDRYDCVIVKSDDETLRNPTIYIKSLNAIPTASDLIRSDDVNEYCLGYIKVEALSTEVTQDDITDTRLNQNLCGVITGVYNQIDGEAITAQWNAAFYAWFDDIKDEFVSHATLVHHYYNNYTSVSLNQTRIPIGISQFNNNTDILLVMVEGRVFAEGIDYTIFSNSYIDLTIGLPVVGTRLMFEVMKSVDGSDAQTVVSQVNTLINQMTVVNNKLQYDYYCNGVNDNIQISNIVKTFLSDGSDNGSLKINVIGNIGVRTYARGTGTSANPYVWFDFLVTDATRRVIVDFGSCSEINIPVVSGEFNVICNSKKDAIINANIIANNTDAGTVIRVFSVPDADIYCERCRFYITAYQDSVIAYSGTFRDCRGSVANIINNSYCFLPSTNGLVKIDGGEYYAFTGDNTRQSAVLGQSGANAVSILYGVNAPTISRSGFYQTHSIIQYAGGGILNCTDLVSTLPLTVTAGISNIRGTIEKNKPNQM